MNCNSPEAKKEVATETSEKKEMVEEVEAPKVNTDSLVATIDAQRKAIEQSLTEPVVLSTDSLREKVKQKWSKIHYYALDGEVVRIKTYPHEGISTRTEEYYTSNGQLALVVIEDNGNSERGKAKENIDKLYYFNDGELIEEVRDNEEEEYSLRKSDGEELLAEFKEYMDLFPNK